MSQKQTPGDGFASQVYLGYLESITQRWLSAKTTLYASEATLARGQINRKFSNWATLGLAGITAISAEIARYAGSDYPWALALTSIVALLSALSKTFESVFVNSIDNSTYIDASTKLRIALDDLTILAHDLLDDLRNRQRRKPELFAQQLARGVAEADRARSRAIAMETARHVEAARSDLAKSEVGSAVKRAKVVLFQLEAARIDELNELGNQVMSAATRRR